MRADGAPGFSRARTHARSPQTLISMCRALLPRSMPPNSIIGKLGRDFAAQNFPNWATVRKQRDDMDARVKRARKAKAPDLQALDEQHKQLCELWSRIRSSQLQVRRTLARVALLALFVPPIINGRELRPFIRLSASRVIFHFRRRHDPHAAAESYSPLQCGGTEVAEFLRAEYDRKRLAMPPMPEMEAASAQNGSATNVREILKRRGQYPRQDMQRRRDAHRLQRKRRREERHRVRDGGPARFGVQAPRPAYPDLPADYVDRTPCSAARR